MLVPCVEDLAPKYARPRQYPCDPPQKIRPLRRRWSCLDRDPTTRLLAAAEAGAALLLLALALAVAVAALLLLALALAVAVAALLLLALALLLRVVLLPTLPAPASLPLDRPLLGLAQAMEQAMAQAIPPTLFLLQNPSAPISGTEGDLLLLLVS